VFVLQLVQVDVLQIAVFISETLLGFKTTPMREVLSWRNADVRPLPAFN